MEPPFSCMRRSDGCLWARGNSQDRKCTLLETSFILTVYQKGSTTEKDSLFMRGY